MVTSMMQEIQERPAESHCIHHWLIETPDGPVSKGICKYCKAEKYFNNELHDKYSAERQVRAVARPAYISEDDIADEEQGNEENEEEG